MATKRVIKVVGKISNDLIKKYKLYNYKNIDIVQSLDLYIHIAKHIPEFLSIDSYNETIINIQNIIKEPLFVYFDKSRNSLLYFKKIKQNICVVVKLFLRKNRNPYIATIYPIVNIKWNVI